jgi:hypothetical protein
MNGCIRRGIRKRDRLLSKYLRRKTPQAWENYRIQRNTVFGFIRKAKKIITLN